MAVHLTESSAENTVVAVISAVGGTAPYVFTLTSQEHAGWLKIVGDELLAGATPADYEADASATVTVQVEDAHGYTFSKAFAIPVVNVNEPPVITSNGGGSTASLSVADGVTAVTTVVAVDPDAGTTLTYSISGGADASAFAINSSSGVLAFVTPPDFDTPTDADTNNAYIVTVRASDGTLYDEQTITVTVTAGAGGGTRTTSAGATRTTSTGATRTFA